MLRFDGSIGPDRNDYVYNYKCCVYHEVAIRLEAFKLLCWLARVQPVVRGQWSLLLEGKQPTSDAILENTVVKGSQTVTIAVCGYFS